MSDTLIQTGHTIASSKFLFQNASFFAFVCFLKALSSLSIHRLRQTAVSNLCGRTSFR